MSLINDPDYTKYSLEDLYDVAQHIDKVRYADRYARVLEEIEKRRQEQPEWCDKAEIFAEEGLFQSCFGDESANEVVRWWETRRVFYNWFNIVLFGCCSIVVFLLFLLFLSYSQDRLRDSLQIFLIVLLVQIATLAVGNFFYTLCWMFDLFLRLLFKKINVKAPRFLSLALFTVFLTLHPLGLYFYIA